MNIKDIKDGKAKEALLKIQQWIKNSKTQVGIDHYLSYFRKFHETLKEKHDDFKKQKTILDNSIKEIVAIEDEIKDFMLNHKTLKFETTFTKTKEKKSIIFDEAKTLLNIDNIPKDKIVKYFTFKLNKKSLDEEAEKYVMTTEKITKPYLKFKAIKKAKNE